MQPREWDDRFGPLIFVSGRINPGLADGHHGACRRTARAMTFGPASDMTWAVAASGGAVLGAVIGSFLGAVLVRWPRDERVTAGRSQCDSCGVRLGVGALVPVLSFALQRGRCRTCGAHIPRAHLVMELAATAIGATCAGLFPAAPALALVGAALGWVLLLLAALDFTQFWLPDRLTLPLGLGGLGAASLGLGPDGGIQAAAIGLVAGYGALALVGWSYRRLRGRDGLGGGDPKLFGAIGAWLGWAALPQVLLAAAGLGLGAVAVLVLAGRKPAATTPLPLGTLLAAAAWPLWLAGHAA